MNRSGLLPRVSSRQLSDREIRDLIRLLAAELSIRHGVTLPKGVARA